MDLKRFFRANYMYFFWAVIYVIITALLFSYTSISSDIEYFFANLVVTAFAYFVFTIAVLLLSDTFLRLSYIVRHIVTNEQNELLTAYETVYNIAKEHTELLSDNIEFFIVKNQGLKVKAIGRKTIVISKLALETFSNEQIQGLLAHEFGRIIYSDVSTNLFVNYGNYYFSLFLCITNPLFKKKKTSKDTPDIKIIKKKQLTLLNLVFKSLYEIIKFVLYSIYAIVYFFANIPILIHNKKRTYQADTFVNEIGYGEGLIQALYILDKFDMASGSFSEHFTADLSSRISYLEQLQAKSN